MNLKSRIKNLEKKIIRPKRRLTWVDLVRFVHGQDIGFKYDPNDPIFEVVEGMFEKFETVGEPK